MKFVKFNNDSSRVELTFVELELAEIESIESISTQPLQDAINEGKLFLENFDSLLLVRTKSGASHKIITHFESLTEMWKKAQKKLLLG